MCFLEQVLYVKKKGLQQRDSCPISLVIGSSGRWVVWSLGCLPTQFETFGFTHMVEEEDSTQIYANDASVNLVVSTRMQPSLRRLASLIWLKRKMVPKFMLVTSVNLAEDYANKLREKHGLAPGASVNAIEDLGLETWQECVGGVTRGRLTTSRKLE